MRSWWRLLWQGISLILNHNIETDIPKCDKVLIAGLERKNSKSFVRIWFPIYTFDPIIEIAGERGTFFHLANGERFKFLPTQSCPKIALAFNEQLFETIPYDDHDFRNDIVFRKLVYSCIFLYILLEHVWNRGYRYVFRWARACRFM